MRTKIFAVTLAAGLSASTFAAPLSESTFTEIVKDVSKVAATTKAAQPAKVNDLVKAPDLVRTGPDSRAELTAPDQTITRIGANSVFSFEPQGRDMNLEKGSVLFHSPSGKGGGTIKSGGASAAVLGTTIIVVATQNGGFKFIVLEGKGKATLKNGKSKKLKAGQVVFILPGGKSFSDVLDINLGRLVGGSKLVGGFSKPVPSQSLIDAAIQQQNAEIAGGRKQDTGISADDFASKQHQKNGLGSVDNNSYQTAIHSPTGRRTLNQIYEGEGTPDEQFNGNGGSGIIILSQPSRNQEP